MAYKTLCNLLSLPLQDPALPPITLLFFPLLLPIIPHFIPSVSIHTLPQSLSTYCVLCLKCFPPESNMAPSISSFSSLPKSHIFTHSSVSFPLLHVFLQCSSLPDILKCTFHLSAFLSISSNKHVPVVIYARS